MKQIARRLANDGAAETVRHDQSRGGRYRSVRKFRRHGEEEQIAEAEIVRPFLVAAQIGECDLDLDAGHDAVRPECRNIETPAVGEPEFDERRQAFGQQQTAYAARHISRGQRK